VVMVPLGLVSQAVGLSVVVVPRRVVGVLVAVVPQGHASRVLMVV
jgi:hypothetical protein